MILQLWAAGGATLLAVRDRFDRIAFAYIAGAVSGLVVYLAVSGTAGELSLGWSMLAMAVVTCAAMLDGVRTSRAPAGAAEPQRPTGRLRRFSRCARLVLGSTAIYLAFNALYVITLAFASNYSAGAATVLSYAYLFASYLVAATGFALGMSRIADMRRGALADWREVIADTVPAGFRYSMLLVAPALAALVAGGATLIGEVLPTSFERRRRRAAARLRRPALRLDRGGAAGQPAAAGAVRARPLEAGQPAGSGDRRPPHRRHRAGRRPLRRRGRRRRLLRRPARLRRRPALRRRRPRERPDRPRARPRRPPLRPRSPRPASASAPRSATPLASGIAAPLLTLAIGSLLYAPGSGCAWPAARCGCCSAPCGPHRHERRGPLRAGAGQLERAPGRLGRGGSPPTPMPARSPACCCSSPCSPASAGAPGAFPRSTPGTSSTSPATLASGGQPYSDIRYFYGPVGLYALGGAFAVFGTSFTTAFAFGLLQAAAIIAAFYALARQLLQRHAGGDRDGDRRRDRLLRHRLQLRPAAHQLGHLRDPLPAPDAAGAEARTAPPRRPRRRRRRPHPARVRRRRRPGRSRLPGRRRPPTRCTGGAAGAPPALPCPPLLVAGGVLALLASSVGSERLFAENLWPVDFLRIAGFNSQHSWAPLDLESVAATIARAGVYCTLLAAVIAAALLYSKATDRKRRLLALWPLPAAVIVLLILDVRLEGARRLGARPVGGAARGDPPADRDELAAGARLRRLRRGRRPPAARRQPTDLRFLGLRPRPGRRRCGARRPRL